MAEKPWKSVRNALNLPWKSVKSMAKMPWKSVNMIDITLDNQIETHFLCLDACVNVYLLVIFCMTQGCVCGR